MTTASSVAQGGAFPPVPAQWNNGKSAISHDVILRVISQKLLILSPTGQELSLWDMEHIDVLSKAKELPLRLAKRHTLEENTIASHAGERLHIAEAQHAQVILSAITPTIEKKQERKHHAWLIATVSVWVFIGLFYFGSPLMFRMAAEVIPRSWEESLGKSSRESIISMLTLVPGTKGVCTLQGGQEALAQITHKLTIAADNKGYSFDIVVLDSTMVNAFALPGGYMVVTTGLIKSCITPDELAGVIAHEMVHVTERHGTSRMLREQTWALLGRLMGGSEYAASTVRDIVLLMVGSGFDRDQERDADIMGAKRMIAANINPEALANFFSRLQKEDKEFSYSEVLSYVASHPNLEERATYLRNIAKQHAYTPALAEKDWDKLKKSLCTPVAGKEI